MGEESLEVGGSRSQHDLVRVDLLLFDNERHVTEVLLVKKRNEVLQVDQDIRFNAFILDWVLLNTREPSCHSRRDVALWDWVA